MRRVFTLAIALTCALTATSLGAADAPFLWEVQGPKARHYLMGSVHMLPASAHPLPAALDAAYANTRALVLESDPDVLSSPEFQNRLLASGASERGLQREIGAGLLQRVQRHLRAIGLPATLCDPLKAWMCGLTLGQLEFQRAGMDAALGIDHRYHQLAQQQAREITWLEAPEQQLAIFADMSAAMGTQFLQSSMDDLDKPELRPDALVRMWRRNDAAALARVVGQMRTEFPQAYARVLADRNRAWMAPLLRHLDSVTPTLMIVGAAHLVGPESLVAALATRGYRLRSVADASAVDP